MKNLILTTVLLSFMLLQATVSMAQTTGQQMSASGPGDVLVINEDASNHFSKIRMQTGSNSAFTLRNNQYEFEIFHTNSTGLSAYGDRLLWVDDWGTMRLKPGAFINNVSKIVGASDRELTFASDDDQDGYSKFVINNSNGNIQMPGTMSVGVNFLPVPGTALAVDGRVHISPEGGVPASFDEVQYSEYLLWVDGGIVAEDFAIEDSDGWADFVFEEGYQLPTLEETASYINEHGHLPTIPSEEEVKEGYEVHEMNKQILQTIEELMLHTIDQNKSIQQLRKRVNQLKQQ